METSDSIGQEEEGRSGRSFEANSVGQVERRGSYIVGVRQEEEASLSQSHRRRVHFFTTAEDVGTDRNGQSTICYNKLQSNIFYQK